MQVISAYQVTSKIYSSRKTIVYRAVRKRDNRPVVLKVPSADYPDAAAVQRLNYEHELLTVLTGPGVIRTYGLDVFGAKTALVLEDFAGETFLNYCRLQRPSTQQILRIAIKCVEALSDIHQQDIIHRDINPANIVINPAGDLVKIIDFNNADSSAGQSQTPMNVRMTASSMAYISPEQTGRMNCGVDYRSDYYSLGITLYEMVTGRLPFQTSDPLELMHCHIAKQPPPINELRPDIPSAVAAVIIKLLAKNASDRYQSAYGLKADLIDCLHRASNGDVHYALLPGRKDLSRRFEIPNKLYGRKTQLDKLLVTFSRVREGATEFCLISGYAGIGKSVLVDTIRKPVTAAQARFIAGKHDQFQRDIPHTALVSAFRQLIQHILTQDTDEISRWRKHLDQNLGANLRIVVDVIPEIELIVGPQVPPVPLPPAEARNRFNLVFKQFVMTFVSAKTPLVIFLDDLQWADTDSIKMIKHLVFDPDLAHLFIIGAYRDNEVDTAHPLRQLLMDLRKAQLAVTTIALKPLPLENIIELVAATIQCDPDRAKPLAKLCLHKTTGNPFFLKQFLESLYDEKYIWFDENPGIWKYRLKAIAQKDITTNVVDLMMYKITRLSDRTINALTVAACIGTRFDLETLALAMAQTVAKTAGDLEEARQKELILALDDLETTVHTDEKENPDASNLRFSFLHDRIHHTVDALTDKVRKTKLHLTIGRLLYQKFKQHDGKTNLFNIVYHLNAAMELIQNKEERNQILLLNARAGKLAKASVAYDVAGKYFEQAIQLLGPEGWREHYDLALDLYTQAVEVAYLNGKFEQMDRLAETALAHCRSVTDKGNIYETRVSALIARYDMHSAVALKLEVLAMLGVKLPHNPGKPALILNLLATKLALRGKSNAELARLPVMETPQQLITMRLVTCGGPAIRLSTPEYLPLFIFKGLLLTLKYGHSSQSPFLFAAYGMILTGHLGEIEAGYRYGQLALQLLDLLGAEDSRARTYYLVFHYIKPWRENGRQLQKSLLKAYQSGLETGDFEYAAFALSRYCSFPLFLGCHLERISQTIEKYAPTLARLNHTIALHWTQLTQQVVANLLGRDKNPCRLQGPFFDETKMLPLQIKANERNGIFQYYLSKLILALLFEKYDDAGENAALADKYGDGGVGNPMHPPFFFYKAILLLEKCPLEARSEQKKFLRQIDSCRKKLKKWSHWAPMTYRHKWYLVEALYWAQHKNDLQAMHCFDRAIELADENRFIHEKAIANELAAKYYLKQSKLKIARTYLCDARHAYTEWGARAKVTHLDLKYEFLLGADTSSTLKPDISGAEPGTGELDLQAVLKSTQAISGEIVLKKLLKRLLRIVFENAGAQHGHLIFEKNNRLVIEVSGSENRFETASLPLEQTQAIPHTIIQYVRRTKKEIVLQDAKDDSLFANDPYLAAHKVKSVLCLPILRQNQLISILYLENNLANGAFTPKRLRVINILAAQAAISIDNARLYAHLDESEKKYRSIIENATEGIVQTTPEGKIMSANPAMLKMLGYESLCAAVKKVNDLGRQVYAEVTDRARLRAMLNAHGIVKGYETKLKRADGELIDVAINAITVNNEQGKVSHYEAVLEDITQRKRWEEFKIAKEAAEAANQAKSEFLAKMSHEIRTPMNVVMGMSDLLAKSDLDPEQRQYVDMLRNASANLMALTNDILDLTKVETGRIGLAKTQFDLFDEAAKTCDQMALKANEKNMALHCSIDPQTPPFLVGDPMRLCQVLTNLIDNAVKFSGHGTIQISITQLSRQPQESGPDQVVLQFSITDSGIGIRADKHDAIFEKFTQADSSTTRRYGGSGLGLAICKQLVELMGGRIWVTSTPGKGSTFYFTAVFECPHRPRIIPKPSTAASGVTEPRPPMHILLVEDNRENQMLFQIYLKTTGHRIDIADNGQLGVEKYKTSLYDLVFMDIEMPVMDGYRATQVIRQWENENNRHPVPIIALTAHALIDSGSKSIQAGCTSHLTKPLEKDQLLETIVQFAPGN